MRQTSERNTVSAIRAIVAIMLCIMVTVIYYPVPTAYAAQTAESGTTYEPKETDDELDYFKQILTESVYDIIPPEMLEVKDYYHEDIKTQIQEQMREALRIIDTAKRMEDTGILEIGGGWITYSNDSPLMAKMEILESLYAFDRSIYNKPADFKNIKTALQNDVKTVEKIVKKKEYNDWYWDVYVNERTKARKLASQITSVTEYIDAVSELSDFFGIADGIANLSIDESYDIIIFFGEDDEDDYEYTLYYEDDKLIYTKEELKTLRKNGQTKLKENIKECEKDGLVVPEELVTKAKNFYKDTKNMEVRNEIAEYYSELNEAIYFQSEPAEKAEGEPLTISDMTRFYRKAMDSLYALDTADYSRTTWIKMAKLCDEYSDKMDNAGTVEKAEKIYQEYLEKLKAFPTDKEEAKQLKKKCAKKWRKKYSNYTKYSKKKAKSVLKKELVKLNAATTTEDVYKAYAEGSAQLEKTIRTFNVRVSKSGKGTVTKSRKVAYGKTYTLKVTPKAGHAVRSVTINGKKQPLKYTYSIKVRKNTKISVKFR